MDFNKLRQIDNNAQPGDAVVYYGTGERATLVGGPDADEYYVFKDSKGCFQYGRASTLAYAPLCWLEEYPVYVGDVLWYKGSDFSMRVTGHNHRIQDKTGLEGVIVEGGKWCDPGDDMWADIASWTWGKPKTKKQAWVVFVEDNDVPFGLYTLPYPYDTEQDARSSHPDAVLVQKIEWEV